METYRTLYALKCVFIQHSAQHQDNPQGCTQVRVMWAQIWQFRKFTEYTNLGIALLCSLMPSPFPQWDTPLQRKKQLAMTWANCWSSIFSSPSDRWPSDGPNRWSKRQPCARRVQHGKNGLPSLRLLPRLLGFIIGICIICKLKMFL